MCKIDQWSRLHLEVDTMMRFWFTPSCRMDLWSRLLLEVGNMAGFWLTSRFRMDQWSRLHLEVDPQKSGKRVVGCGLGLWARAVGCGLWARLGLPLYCCINYY